MEGAPRLCVHSRRETNQSKDVNVPMDTERASRCAPGVGFLSTFSDIEPVRLRSWRSAAVGYSVFVFLVRDQLIDTGFPGAREAVARFIDERRPRGVVVTHQHE